MTAVEDRPAGRAWPSRAEWAAKAEYAARTFCTRWERLPKDARFITDAEETEARELGCTAGKTLRPLLTAEIDRLRALLPDRPEKSRERAAWLYDLPEGRYKLACDLAALEDMRRTVARAVREDGWGHVRWTLGRLRRHYPVMLAGGLDVALDRLEAIGTAVQARRDAEAQRLEDEAVAREVARRVTDEAWVQELEWRAQVESPRVVRYGVGEVA